MMTGGQYLAQRIAELELSVATLLEHQAALEKERDALKAELAEKEPSALSTTASAGLATSSGS